MNRFKFPPSSFFYAATLFVLLIVSLSSLYASSQPWLGVGLQSVASRGLQVMEVAEESAAAGQLVVGDIIFAIREPGGKEIRLEGRDLIEDPDQIPTFIELNSFREHQSSLHNLLHRPHIQLLLEDGRIVDLHPRQERAFTSLPLRYWLLSLYSLIALLVGITIWVIQRNSTAPRFLLLSGFGAVILLNTANIIATRELALDGSELKLLTIIYHFGFACFSLGMNGLWWFYPKRITRLPVIPVMALVMIFFLLNESFQWTELPINSVLVQVPFYISAALVALICQWRMSRENPVNRAILKFLALVWLGISGTMLASFFVPAESVWLPDIRLSSSFLAMLLVYLSFVPAIMRYRLFNIDRWWFEVWLWFFAGLLIALIDVGLISFVSINSSFALAVSVIAVGWGYFPVRQWLWAKVFRRMKRDVGEYLPLLLSYLMRSDQLDNENAWMHFLQEVFQPLNIVRFNSDEPGGVLLLDGGTGLYIPPLRTGRGIEMSFTEKGRRLFSHKERQLAESLLDIARHVEGQREAHARGVSEERSRIMRDLHDDVGGRLLTLIHAEQAEPQVAKDALKSLREIIYSLDTDQNMALNEAVARWRLEVFEFCERHGLDFQWQWREACENLRLAPRALLNLTMIIREAMTNAVRHANPSRLTMMFDYNEEQLGIHIENDGAVNTGKILHGKGLKNMSVRMGELDGNFDKRVDHERCSFVVRLSMPLREEKI